MCAGTLLTGLFDSIFITLNLYYFQVVLYYQIIIFIKNKSYKQE